MKVRVTKSTYRGKNGFLVTEIGPRRHIYPQKIFVESRTAADRVRDRMKADEEVTLADISSATECPECGTQAVLHELWSCPVYNVTTRGW